MYVCVCNAVTERDIHRAAAQGCHTMKELGRQLGVATECGRCASCARRVLQEATQPAAPALHPAALAAA